MRAAAVIKRRKDSVSKDYKTIFDVLFEECVRVPLCGVCVRACVRVLARAMCVRACVCMFVCVWTWTRTRTRPRACVSQVP